MWLIEEFTARPAVLDHCPDLVPFDSLPPLTGPELRQLLQWEARDAMLGSFGDAAALRRETIVAVSEGTVDEACARLTSALDDLAMEPEVVVRRFRAPVTRGRRVPGRQRTSVAASAHPHEILQLVSA